MINYITPKKQLQKMIKNHTFKLRNYTNRTDFTDIELTPKEAILAKCYDCCCYDRKEVKACNIKQCPLHNLKNKWLHVSE